MKEADLFRQRLEEVALVLQSHKPRREHALMPFACTERKRRHEPEGAGVELYSSPHYPALRETHLSLSLYE